MNGWKEMCTIDNLKYVALLLVWSSSVTTFVAFRCEVGCFVLIYIRLCLHLCFNKNIVRLNLYRLALMTRILQSTYLVKVPKCQSLRYQCPKGLNLVGRHLEDSNLSMVR